MHTRRLLTLVTLAILLTLGVFPRPSTAGQAVGPEQPPRQGAWLDSVVFTQASPGEAFTRLQAGELDLYASTLDNPALFQAVLEDPTLALGEFYGSYDELTFNPSGPTFHDGRLNPFSSAAIREAVNWLIDREYIAHTILGGLASPRWTILARIMPDYTRYQSTLAALEAEYAYDLERARQAIGAEMLALGAVLQDGVWHHGGQPITLIFVIRIEDQRREIGTYVAGQLEAIGFRVDRRYLNRTEAGHLWVESDPADGLWHIYTGGWITQVVDRDSGEDFSFFYMPYDYPIPLHHAYTPSPGFADVGLRLRDKDYGSMAERDQLFVQALGLAMNDSGSGSVRIWLADHTSFAPRRANVAVVNDLAGGIYTAMWPHVARFEDQEGGALRIGQPGLFVDPWNPIAGSNWIYDGMPIEGTQDSGFLFDPHTGLARPQRVESAEVVVKAGLPVTRTLDWVALSFEDQIVVPDDAWVDWDAEEMRFITAAEKYSEPVTANTMSTVAYPADLFTTVTWHDGSPLDVADFVIRMIMQFDPAKPESPIYDEGQVAELERFLEHFKGVRIESTEPLVITTYDDSFALDAENIPTAWWPNDDRGPGAWHGVGLGVRAEAAGDLAFSADKAGQLGVEWANYLAGPSLGILATHLNAAAVQGYIPYEPALAPYVTGAEAAARWANLQVLYATRGHFWVGSGPFYVGDVQWDVPSLTLEHFDAFPDPAGRWDALAELPPPELAISYPTGAPGSYLNVLGSGFPAGGTASVAVNNHLLADVPVDDSGELAFTLATDEADEGVYHVQVRVNPVAGVQFELDSAEPARPLEGELPLVTVPDGLITYYVYLPVLLRSY